MKINSAKKVSMHVVQVSQYVREITAQSISYQVYLDYLYSLFLLNIFMPNFFPCQYVCVFVKRPTNS